MTPEEFVGEISGVNGLMRLGLSYQQAHELAHAIQYMTYIQGADDYPEGVQVCLHSRTRVSLARLLPVTAHGYRIETWVGGKQIGPKERKS